MGGGCVDNSLCTVRDGGCIYISITSVRVFDVCR